MKVVMDSDCLIKLVKAGAKEAVVAAMYVFIPPAVKRETVEEAKKRGYQDAAIIEENIAAGKIELAKPRTASLRDMMLTKGEGEVFSLYQRGGYDVIASDDDKFLRKLHLSNIPFLTPAACIVYVARNRGIEKSTAVEMLERLSQYVSRDEYMTARYAVEERA